MQAQAYGIVTLKQHLLTDSVLSPVVLFSLLYTMCPAYHVQDCSFPPFESYS